MIRPLEFSFVNEDVKIKLSQSLLLLESYVVRRTKMSIKKVVSQQENNQIKRQLLTAFSKIFLDLYYMVCILGVIRPFAIWPCETAKSTCT